MNIGLRAHVLMGNDFPDAVYFTKRGVERAIAALKKAEAEKQEREPWNRFNPGVHWRAYEFPIGPQLRVPSLAELAWRRRMRG